MENKNIYILDLFNEELKKMIPTFYDEMPNPMETAAMVEQRHLGDLKNHILKYLEYFSNGYQFYLNCEALSCKEKLESLLTEDGLTLAVEYMEAGSSLLGLTLNLNEEDYEALYNIANVALKDNPILARDLYTTLLFLNHLYVEYWIGLALATSRLDDIPETELIYKTAILLNPLDPVPFLYYGHYLTSLNDPRADLFLEQAKALQESA